MSRSKKGFTMVELTIVIAVTAIVVTMVCTFMLAYQHQSHGIYKTGNAVSEINRFKKAVNDWLDECDNGNVGAGSGGLTSDEDTLVFDPAAKKLTWDKPDAVGEDEIFLFEEITGCTFYKKPGIADTVYCTVTAGQEEIILAFDLFDPHTGRERYFTE